MACNYIKKETLLAQVFSCEFYEVSKNTFYDRTPPVAASGRYNLQPCFETSRKNKKEENLNILNLLNVNLNVNFAVYFSLKFM